MTSVVWISDDISVSVNDLCSTFQGGTNLVLLPAGRFESRTMVIFTVYTSIFFYHIACHVTENHRIYHDLWKNVRQIYANLQRI